MTSIRVHKNQQHGIGKTKKCDKCDKIYPTAARLQNHLKNVHQVGDSKMFVCTECGKLFSLKESLTTHMRIHKPQTEASSKCSKCYKTYNTEALMKTHFTKNHKNLQCDQCDHVPFSTLSSFNRHNTTQHKREEDPLYNLDDIPFIDK
jgi:DNA-directed RNA polymerase subunit RPC12/RpoP